MNANTNSNLKLTARIAKRKSEGAGNKREDETIQQALETALKWHTAQIDDLADTIRRLNAHGITAVKPEQAGALHMIYTAGAAVDLAFGTVGWPEDGEAS